MSHPALTIIRDEHGALSAMLRSLSMLLAQARRERAMPDFDVLRAMLFYVDEFPEQLHHTKESELLFPKLRARCPEIASVLEGRSYEMIFVDDASRDDTRAELAALKAEMPALRVMDPAMIQRARDMCAHISLRDDIGSIIEAVCNDCHCCKSSLARTVSCALKSPALSDNSTCRASIP